MMRKNVKFFVVLLFVASIGMCRAGEEGGVKILFKEDFERVASKDWKRGKVVKDTHEGNGTRVMKSQERKGAFRIDSVQREAWFVVGKDTWITFSYHIEKPYSFMLHLINTGAERRLKDKFKKKYGDKWEEEFRLRGGHQGHMKYQIKKPVVGKWTTVSIPATELTWWAFKGVPSPHALPGDAFKEISFHTLKKADEDPGLLFDNILVTEGRPGGDKQTGGKDRKYPWDPGVEKPRPEALNSALYIKPVPAAEKSTLKLTVTEQMGIARKNAPVRGGIPFKRGELRDPKNIRLLDHKGKEIPVQAFITCYWPERTIRWLCIDLLTDIKAGETKTFTLEYGAKVKARRRSSLKIAEKADTIRIDTGRMKVSFSPGQRFSGQVIRKGGGTKGEIKGELLLSQGDGAAKPVPLPLRVDEVKLVEQGPVQATIYLKGGYGDEMVHRSRSSFKQEQHIARYWNSSRKGITAPKFAFHGFVRIYGDTCRMEVIHSFGYNGDENKDFVRRYGLVIPVNAAKNSPFIYGGDLGKRQDAQFEKRLVVTQGRHDWWKLSGDRQAKGRRFGGWAALKNQSGFTTMALRNAWQQWPVTIEARTGGELALYIYGAPEGEFLDLRYQGEHFGKSKSMYVGPELSYVYWGGDANGRAPGILKISELCLDFEDDPGDAGAGVHRPLVVSAGAERIAETMALGFTGTYEGAKAWPDAKSGKVNIDEHVRWARTILDFPVIQHEANGMYGWVDWPDQGDARAPKNGKFQMVMQGGLGWTNGERALLGYYFHYAAGGLEKYLHLGHAMALHTIGIDMDHPGGEMSPGTVHRHNQVHWRTYGRLRQCAARGWYTDYWMTGHPEIGRILRDVFQAPYRPKPGPEAEPVLVCNVGTPYNYANWLSYLTTNNPIWIKHHKAIDGAFLEAVNKGLAIPGNLYPGQGKMTWENGRIKLINTKPGPIGGYWYTYGGDDRLAEHASLFGYDVSIKALKALGDGHFGEGKKAPGKMRIASPENGFTAYYLLTGNPKVPAWLVNVNLMAWPKLTCLKKNGKLIEWDAYTVKGTAEEWHGLFGRQHGWPPEHMLIYKQNGYKITAAIVHEIVYTLAALEFAAKQPE